MINYLLLTTWIMMIIGHSALAYFVWRFSRRKKVSFQLANFKTEWKLSLIPCLIMALVAEGGVFAIGMPVWHKFFGSPAPPDALVVEVTAQQFAWNFRYPGKDGAFGRTDPKLIDDDNVIGLDPVDAASKDDVVESGLLRIPVNRPVKLRLRSRDVIHSFFLPYHRVQQDIVPGMTVDIWFTPNKTGTYEILCTQLCGMGHFRMRGVLTVLPQEEFKAWQEAH
jgi:cytochrome c oxidase subunit II